MSVKHIVRSSGESKSDFWARWASRHWRSILRFPAIGLVLHSRSPDVHPRLDAAIVSDLLNILEELRPCQFSLLWLDGREGSKAHDFYSRRGKEANLFTMILDTKGNISGGFIPLEWERRDPPVRELFKANRDKADASLKSFLFTLENPHNIPARSFPLNPEKKEKAILCSSKIGTNFNDIIVFNDGNIFSTNHTYDFSGNSVNEIESINLSVSSFASISSLCQTLFHHSWFDFIFFETEHHNYARFVECPFLSYFDEERRSLFHFRYFCNRKHSGTFNEKLVCGIASFN
jgi:hypothetical protein